MRARIFLFAAILAVLPGTGRAASEEELLRFIIEDINHRYPGWRAEVNEPVSGLVSAVAVVNSYARAVGHRELTREEVLSAYHRYRCDLQHTPSCIARAGVASLANAGVQP